MGTIMTLSSGSAFIPKGATSAERNFMLRWFAAKGPDLQWQHRPIETRRFAIDFAHLGSRVGIEVDGGVWRGIRGAHGGSAKIKDCERDLEIMLAGWNIVRVTPQNLSGSSGWSFITKLIELIRIRSEERFQSRQQ